MPLRPGNYIVLNKFFKSLNLVLDQRGLSPNAGADIITYPMNSPVTSNQKWNVTEHGDRYTFQAIFPDSNAFVPVQTVGAKLEGSPDKRMVFFTSEHGKTNEYQITTGPDGRGLAWQASGTDTPVKLEDADATNERQIWIFSRLK